MSDDLLAWLRAEIEADRRDADVKIIRQRWEIDPDPWVAGTGIRGEDGRPVAVAIGDYAARHIVRHAPLDKLADCEAKLAILDEHQPVDMPTGIAWRGCRTCQDPSGWRAMWPCRTVRLIGVGYARRPGYRQAWAP